MTIVPAAWVEGFATRLLQLRPGKTPLGAVFDATTVFADSADLPPEEAAELFDAAEAQSVKPRAPE